MSKRLEGWEEKEVDHEDGDTILPKSACALVVDNGEFSLLLPAHAEDEKVPPEVVLMTAMYIRANKDPEWVDDLIEWLDAHTGAANDDEGEPDDGHE